MFGFKDPLAKATQGLLASVREIAAAIADKRRVITEAKDAIEDANRAIKEAEEALQDR